MWLGIIELFANVFSFGLSAYNPESLPPLKFRNTLSGELETFKPLNHTVRMYNCGPTAYDEQHIGNLFPPVIANLVHRTLLVWGYKVDEVNNITDFGHISEDEASEDKMTKGMRREGMAPSLKNMRALAEKYAELFWHDLPELGINPKKIRYPFASDYIREQIAVIKSLEQKGYAYTTTDGVYFDVVKFPAYGKLGSINLEGQRAGARVEERQEKRGPNDFALWKLDSKFGWQSPRGKGFPGWHTECVAMIFSLLGRQIDIHMGGVDLIPVHHNNEIAQAEAITQKQFVNYWLHNAHITIEGKKVSKSIGNTIYLHNIVDKGFSPRALRYWFLGGHYRTPMNFTWDAIAGADVALGRLRRTYLELGEATPKMSSPETTATGSPSPSARRSPNAVVSSDQESFLTDFYSAIADDLNTPKALARVWDLVKDESVSPALKRQYLVEADRILGLGFADEGPRTKVKVVERSELPAGVGQLVSEREEARINKDFTKADELRTQIESAGYELTDTPEGVKIAPKP